MSGPKVGMAAAEPTELGATPRHHSTSPEHGTCTALPMLWAGGEALIPSSISPPRSAALVVWRASLILWSPRAALRTLPLSHPQQAARVAELRAPVTKRTTAPPASFVTCARFPAALY